MHKHTNITNMRWMPQNTNTCGYILVSAFDATIGALANSRDVSHMLLN
jgi:hypothetical protein